MALGQNLVALVNIKIAGKWVFIPLTLIIIGFDTHPYIYNLCMSGVSVLIIAGLPPGLAHQGGIFVAAELRLPWSSHDGRTPNISGIIENQ